MQVVRRGYERTSFCFARVLFLVWVYLGNSFFNLLMPI